MSPRAWRQIEIDQPEQANQLDYAEFEQVSSFETRNCGHTDPGVPRGILLCESTRDAGRTERLPQFDDIH